MHGTSYKPIVGWFTTMVHQPVGWFTTIWVVDILAVLWISSPVQFDGGVYSRPPADSKLVAEAPSYSVDVCISDGGFTP